MVLLSCATADEGELVDGVPILPIYEPSPVLHTLLLHCDPNIGSKESSVGLREVQDLALKYEMFGGARAIYRDRNPASFRPHASQLDSGWDRIRTCIFKLLSTSPHPLKTMTPIPSGSGGS